MGVNSAIAWTHHTFNPVVGCVKVSAACDHCYAAEYAKRYEPKVTWGEPGQKAVYRRTVESNWRKPLSWNKHAKEGGYRARVFCASLADVFDNGWDAQWRADLWRLIAATPHLDWLLLTKRPQNIKHMLPPTWTGGWANVWLGTTVENQEEAERRIPHLLSVGARHHFLSCEPLLGPLDLGTYVRWKCCVTDTPAGMDGSCGDCDPCIGAIGRTFVDWVIIGGESGHGFRPMSMEWVADLRVQCRDARVPVFFKQDSSIKPGCKGRASDALWATREFPHV